MKKIVIILIVLFVGSGAFLLSFKDGDAKIVKDALSAMEEADSFSYKMEIGIDLKGASALLTSNGFISELSSKGNFNADVIDYTDTYSLEGDFIISGEDFYIKMISIPLVFSNIFYQFGISAEDIQDNWIIIETERTEDDDKTVSNEFLSAINRSFSIEKQSEEEDKNVYLINFRKERLSRALHILFQELQEEEEFFNEGVPDEGEILEYLNTMDDLSIQAWIGKEDNLIYRVFFENSIEYMEENIFFSFDLNFFGFNEEVEVEVPEEFERIEDIVPPFFL